MHWEVINDATQHSALMVWSAICSVPSVQIQFSAVQGVHSPPSTPRPNRVSGSPDSLPAKLSLYTLIPPNFKLLLLSPGFRIVARSPHTPQRISHQKSPTFQLVPLAGNRKPITLRSASPGSPALHHSILIRSTSSIYSRYSPAGTRN